MVVLVGYATDHGSTGGVAERIGERLRRHGIGVEVRRLTDDLDAVGYDAVVLGSAIHGGKWLPEGQRFVERNAAVLFERPVWLFSVSTLGDEDSMFSPRVAKRLRALRKETPEIAGFRTAIQPHDHRNFAGAIARSHWPAPGRAFFRAMGGRYGDHRNWPAIDAWADSIAVQVRSPASGGTWERAVQMSGGGEPTIYGEFGTRDESRAEEISKDTARGVPIGRCGARSA